MEYHQILASRALGGAARVALDLAVDLKRRAQPTLVWLPGAGPAAFEAERLGVSARLFNGAALSSSSRRRSTIECLHLYRKLATRPRGLAHVHSPYLYRSLLPALKLARLKTVVHVHLEEPPEALRWALRIPPDLIVTCSHSLVEHVRRCLPANRRDRQSIAAVPNAVDTSRFYPSDKQAAKERVAAPSDWPLVLMLANLAPHKGQETTIRAVASLKSRGHNVICWLAGTDRENTGYAEQLIRLARELGVNDRIRLLGQRSDAAELLRAADFFLLPSSREGMPLSILEAQATALPVLASFTAGIPEIVKDGETGFLIPADDANGYADRIARLLAAPGLAASLGENSRRLVCAGSDWQAYVTRIEALYAALSGRSSTQRRGLWPSVGRTHLDQTLTVA